MHINVRQGLTVCSACGMVRFTIEQDKRSAQENGRRPAEGVTLSGVPVGTRTVRGCDSGEARPRVPKVQSGDPRQSLRQKDRDEQTAPPFFRRGSVFAPS